MNRLHYFCTVARTGSLVKASELLNISQPAISKAIKTLESELGKKIIQASGRGIALTDFGHDLAARAEPLIEQINLLGVNESPNDSQHASLKVATFEVFSTYFLGKVISQSFADQRVEVYELTPGALEESIVTRKADIGITYLPIPRPELDILKITSVEMGVFGSKSAFGSKAFEDLPFVVPNLAVAGTPSKVRGLDGWPDDKIPRNILFSVSMMETALDLCRRGVAVGYFPKFVASLHNRMAKVEFKLDALTNLLKKPQKFQGVYMIKRKSDLESKRFKKISSALRSMGR